MATKENQKRKTILSFRSVNYTSILNDNDPLHIGDNNVIFYYQITNLPKNIALKSLSTRQQNYHQKFLPHYNSTQKLLEKLQEKNVHHNEIKTLPGDASW